MSPAEIKKLLIDLDLTIAAIGRAVGGLSRAAIWKYFRGDLKNPTTRRRIETVLKRRALEKAVDIPGQVLPDLSLTAGVE